MATIETYLHQLIYLLHNFHEIYILAKYCKIPPVIDLYLQKTTITNQLQHKEHRSLQTSQYYV